MIFIDVSSTRAIIRRQGQLTSGLIGAKVKFRFSEEWAQLTKTVVFRGGGVTRDVVGVDTVAKIPHEVLLPGIPLEIGVYGTASDKSVVIPTVWARTNLIRPGAVPSGVESTDLQVNGKTIIMLGDSNAAGVGWYQANGESKNDTNDGVFAVLRKKMPSATFLNYAISGAGFVDGTNILEQIESIEGTPDIIFLWAGGNDISEYIHGNMTITAPEMISFAYEDFDESLYGNVNKALYTLRTRYPLAKICGVIRTYNQNQRIDIQQGIYGIISNIYRKYQCSVLNLNDYSNIVQNIEAQEDYWYDTKHYSQKAFVELIAPIFYAALINNLNVNTYIPIQHMFTTLDHDNNEIASLENAFVQRINRSGSVILQNIPEGQHDVFVGARIGYEEVGALRVATRKHSVEHRFSYGSEQGVATVKMTTELSEGCDIANCISGKYVVPKTVRPSCTGLPDDLSEDVGFIIDIDIVDSTGFRYATIIDGRKNRWVGTYKQGQKSYSWDSITTEGGLLLKESEFDEDGDETKLASVVIATRGARSEDDTDVVSGIVEFTETLSGGTCILRNIGDGVEDNDAATVGQLNKKNSIVFYNGSVGAIAGQLVTLKYNPSLASQTPNVGDWLLSLDGCLCTVAGDIHTPEDSDTSYVSLRCRAVINKDVVLYTEQTLTEDEQSQARANIGAASISELIGTDNNLEELEASLDQLQENSVLTTEQSLTEEQQAQARANIGAMEATNNLIIHESEWTIGAVELAEVIVSATGVRSDDGTDVLSAIVDFYEKHHDGLCLLRHIADGVRDFDAATVGQLNAAVGDIETALDSIIAIQESLIGGASE